MSRKDQNTTTTTGTTTTRYHTDFHETFYGQQVWHGYRWQNCSTSSSIRSCIITTTLLQLRLLQQAVCFQHSTLAETDW